MTLQQNIIIKSEINCTSLKNNFLNHLDLQILSCGPYGEITLCKVLHIYQARSAGNAKLVARENFALQSGLFKYEVKEYYNSLSIFHRISRLYEVKVIYYEKTTNFCKISTVVGWSKFVPVLSN